MKVTSVEKTAKWEWYIVEIEDDPAGEESYSVCVNFDYNSNSSNILEITPEPSTKEVRELIVAEMDII